MDVFLCTLEWLLQNTIMASGGAVQAGGQQQQQQGVVEQVEPQQPPAPQQQQPLRRAVWSGALEWTEKARQEGMAKIVRNLGCTVSINEGDPEM